MRRPVGPGSDSTIFGFHGLSVHNTPTPTSHTPMTIATLVTMRRFHDRRFFVTLTSASSVRTALPLPLRAVGRRIGRTLEAADQTLRPVDLRGDEPQLVVAEVGENRVLRIAVRRRHVRGVEELRVRDQVLEPRLQELDDFGATEFV